MRGTENHASDPPLTPGGRHPDRPPAACGKPAPTLGPPDPTRAGRPAPLPSPAGPTAPRERLRRGSTMAAETMPVPRTGPRARRTPSGSPISVRSASGNALTPAVGIAGHPNRMLVTISARTVTRNAGSAAANEFAGGLEALCSWVPEFMTPSGFVVTARTIGAASHATIGSDADRVCGQARARPTDGPHRPAPRARAGPQTGPPR